MADLPSGTPAEARDDILTYTTTHPKLASNLPIGSDSAGPRTLKATVPSANLAFAPLSVPIDKLGLIDVEVRIKPVSDFTGPVTFAADGIHIALSGEVTAEADVLLNKCTIGPFRTSLTTDHSGTLIGAPFAGTDPTNLTGKLVGNQDAVPRATRSWRCPIGIADLFDAITGLPSPAGESWLTFDGALTLTPAGAAALHG